MTTRRNWSSFQKGVYLHNFKHETCTHSFLNVSSITGERTTHREKGLFQIQTRLTTHEGFNAI